MATILDDVVLMAKIAAKKTAGVLGNDLAWNAEQVSGIREKLWTVARGLLRNKLMPSNGVG